MIHLHELFRPPHLHLGRLLRSTPYVVSTHGAAAPQNLQRYRLRKAAYGRLVERQLAGRAAALVALTAAERDELADWLPGAPPITVIPNVADPSLLAAPAWHTTSGSHEVISLARWDVRHKGLDRLATLAAAFPGTTFTVHGSRCGNEPERLEQLRHQAPGNLCLAPAVHGQAKADRLRAARAFVLLSRWEGLSMALLEAMALGVPCLVSPEVARTLGPGAPVVTLANEPTRAADDLRAALDDDAGLASLGAEGRCWVAERAAAPGTVARATEDLYRRVIDGHRPAAVTAPVRAGA